MTRESSREAGVTMTDTPPAPPAAYRPVEVLAAFLKLGLTAFGGPIAHLGYFRQEFVARRRWLDERAYADLVALAQLLPGPATSPSRSSPSCCSPSGAFRPGSSCSSRQREARCSPPSRAIAARRR